MAEEEPSKTPFYIAAALLVIYAAVLSAVGIAPARDVPADARASATALMLVGVVLVAGVMVTAVITGIRSLTRHNGGRDLTLPLQRSEMGTEEQSENGGGVATASDSLTITDNRTGKTYEVPIEDGTVRATALRDIKVNDDDFGVMAYDPAFMNTASCRSAITYLDGETGVLEYRGYPIEQLAEHSTYLEVAYLLVHGELPNQQQLDEWTHEITIHTFVHENVRSFMQGFRYDAHPMGMLLASVGALSTFYPDANKIHDPGDPLPADHPADREDADAGGVRLPPQHGAAVRLSGQRPALSRQLPLDAVQDDRAQVRAGSAARAGAGHPLHPARRPRAELLHERGAGGRLLAGRPVLGGRGRRRRALRPAARRRQRAGAADAAPDRDQGEHPRLHQGREGRQGAPDGLRAPGLQELRPAREDHQEGDRGRLRGHRARTRCSTSRSSSRRSRSRTSTSSSASCTRTSTSTRG